MSIDLAAILGTLIALIGALVGFSGDTGALTVFFLVLVGAVLLTYSFGDVKKAFKSIFSLYQKAQFNAAPVIAEIVQVAAVARKEGVLAMEASRASIKDPLLKKAIKYVIDGFDAGSVQAILGAEIRIAWEAEEATALIFEGIGKLAPVLGILASLLALLHVHFQASNEKLGEALLGALLPSVLGLALGQVIFAPWGKRVRQIAAKRRILKDVVQLGILGIQEGLNPTFLQAKLSLYAQK